MENFTIHPVLFPHSKNKRVLMYPNNFLSCFFFYTTCFGDFSPHQAISILRFSTNISDKVICLTISYLQRLEKERIHSDQFEFAGLFKEIKENFWNSLTRVESSCLYLAVQQTNLTIKFLEEKFLIDQLRSYKRNFFSSNLFVYPLNGLVRHVQKFYLLTKKRKDIAAHQKWFLTSYLPSYPAETTSFDVRIVAELFYKLVLVHSDEIIWDFMDNIDIIIKKSYQPDQ